MTGEWVVNEWVMDEPDPHECAKPEYDYTVKVGDKWQCDGCQAIWRVDGFDSGMQWDPYDHTVIKWSRVQEHPIYTSSWRD